MSVLDKQETLLLYTIGENHHFNTIGSSFVIAVPLPFSPPFKSKHKNALFGYPDIFDMLDKSFLIAYISQNTSKRVGAIKNKMCVFTMRETFVLQAYAKNVRIPK